MTISHTTRITITLPEALVHELEEYAKRDYSSRSDMIRLALLHYMRQLPPLPNPSKSMAADEATLQRLQRDKLGRYLEKDLEQHPELE